MNNAGQLIGFLAMAYAVAIAAWPGLRLRGLGWWLSIGCGGVVLLAPLLIAPQHVQLRALACVLAIDLFFKMVDYATQQRAGSIDDTRFRTYLAFLIPFPVFLVRFGQRKPRTQPFLLREGMSMLAALAAFALCFGLVDIFSRVEMVRSSFLVDHTLKFLIFGVAVETLARGLHGLERMAGYGTPPLIDGVFRSRTVGEFWCRFNTRVHSWFDHNVFRPSGGMRRPVRAIILVFFVSGVLHELGFTIATSRFDGYQLAFFLLQAPAVILCPHGRSAARMSAPARLLVHGATVLWLWATSILFFRGVDRVFPFFYTADPWLP